MTGHDIDPISFKLGQMSTRLTDFEASASLDRMTAAKDRNRLDAVERKTNYMRAQIGFAVVILSGVAFGGLQLIMAGFSTFGTEIKAAIRTLFHGGP